MPEVYPLRCLFGLLAKTNAPIRLKNIRPSIFHNGIVAIFMAMKPKNDSNNNFFRPESDNVRVWNTMDTHNSRNDNSRRNIDTNYDNIGNNEVFDHVGSCECGSIQFIVSIIY